ncbi:hypothetical protein L226DRAFT_536757 [Lentinus tigrinus ALCF2SS1-7]|uniref:Uncharacterized protein n=1 Tax=Lentinus tigrinus ALCF2SS1-6 TaxID=1328759 RepID=A0A5C2S3T4_9APHY|nr:hypothetical protein L227DRAFT_613035 [Lentinus tigrinus ALCF2SS1-6]RPD72909.1 hypothetical protein L226DRAFT_536757 [Lentinus tigrinus ALCF2SS1-7]
MKYAYAALVSLAIAAGGVAVFTPRDDTTVPCAGAKALSTSSVAVGSDTVELTTFSCDAVPSAHKASPVAAASDACADTTCTNVCAESGSLPPTSEDCDKIFDAISIFNSSISTFTVNPNRATTLSFGTCRAFLQNFSPSAPLTFCWTDFAAVAAAAGKACFPPVQPVMSEGLCEAPEGVWRVGIAHS